MNNLKNDEYYIYEEYNEFISNENPFPHKSTIFFTQGKRIVIR